jgi:peroxiredoxin
MDQKGNPAPQFPRYRNDRMAEDTASALARAFKEAIDLDAPITERLAMYAAVQRQQVTPYAEAIDRLVARLEAVSAGKRSPKIGESLPDFLLPDEEGRLIGLSDLLRNGPLVVAFHRGHWCPFCRINAHGLVEIHERARKCGAQIVAISPERGHYTALQRQQAGAKYLMLSDIENAYALSLNLAVWIDDDVRAHLLGFGRDLGVYLGSEGWILPIPATFVVSTNGKIVARFVDPDHRRRMDLDAILAALDHAN